ncbi:hypothetical protein WKI65_42900 [Streptomyces sp. MS1.AVA.3]|uniref:hypothetical protein n=1 Tax=Streptomyces decoyicus TaxID=249567 RepID=UPI0030BBD969
MHNELLPVGCAHLEDLEPEEGVYCEACRARLATGIYNADGVETLLCRGCGQDRTPDGDEVAFDRGGA